jgi:hypothetical protein
MHASHRAKSRKDMITRTIALDRDMHRQLAIAGLDHRVTVNELLRRIVRQWLQQKHQKPPRRSKPKG